MRRLALSAALLAGSAAALALAPVTAAAQEATEALQEVRDRAAIHELLRDYGRMIDEREFEAFGNLFTAEGEYGSGPAMAVGPDAIAARMRSTFESNALGFADPNFHVFFNEVITLDGDRAGASSMSFYVVPGEDGLPEIALMARYEDELVRVGDEWKFRRRNVTGLMPTAP